MGLARLAGADLGFCGEVAGCRGLKARPISPLVYRGQPGFHVDEAGIDGLIADPGTNPGAHEPIRFYFERALHDDGAALSNEDFFDHDSWYSTYYYQRISSVCGTDPTLWCFRSIPGLSADESLGTTVCRSKGRWGFTGREGAIVRETVAAITLLMGGPLARFADPSPGDLAPRVRCVLSCLLEGDTDKQVAARLKISVHTVNQYTKIILKHFGVRSRTELLARWIRRRWGSRSSPGPDGQGPNPAPMP